MKSPAAAALTAGTVVSLACAAGCAGPPTASEIVSLLDTHARTDVSTTAGQIFGGGFRPECPSNAVRIDASRTTYSPSSLLICGEGVAERDYPASQELHFHKAGRWVMSIPAHVP